MKSGKKIAILGIVNLTDDSFYAASRMLGAGTSALLALVERHLEEGADRIDIGACSTRPGSVPVEMEEVIATEEQPEFIPRTRSHLLFPEQVGKPFPRELDFGCPSL